MFTRNLRWTAGSRRLGGSLVLVDMKDAGGRLCQLQRFFSGVSLWSRRFLLRGSQLGLTRSWWLAAKQHVLKRASTPAELRLESSKELTSRRQDLLGPRGSK